MTPPETNSDMPRPSNEMSRRTFMKKSALTVGAVTLLGQGIGLAAATGSGGSGSGSGSGHTHKWGKTYKSSDSDAWTVYKKCACGELKILGEGMVNPPPGSGIDGLPSDWAEIECDPDVPCACHP